MKRYLLAIYLLILATSCTSDANKTQEPEPEPSPSNSTFLDAKLMLTLVNEARTKGCLCGDKQMPPVTALTWNKQLETSARTHAIDMAKQQKMTHIGSDGSRSQDRITRAGYRWRVAGENIAYGMRNEREAVAAWLKSPGHCANIMDARYTEMGADKDSPSGLYWTQNFATPL